MLKADHALMEEAIQRTSRDAGVQTEVEAAPTLSPEGLNALRDGVTEVAAKLAALTAKLEGSGSSVRKLVAEDATGELAARIRTLLDQETLPDDDASHDAELAPDTSATEVAAAKRSASKRGRAVAG